MILVVTTLVIVASTASSFLSSTAVNPPKIFTIAPDTAYPDTGFGGYSLPGEVQRISAELQVPTISVNSRDGQASTWIGSQGPASRFIQLGIVEASSGDGHSEFEAFWSDTTQGFLPQYLGQVTSGQLVLVSMLRIRGGWILHLQDQGDSLVVNKTIAYAGFSSFNRGEWIQEDPTPYLVSPQDVPYPQMTAVRFSNLMVNGRQPRLTRHDAMILMAFGGEINVPTRVHSDSFTFLRPRGSALQYLVNVRNVDRAASLFDVAFATWQFLPNEKRNAAADKFANSYDQFEKALVTQNWPRSLQSTILKEAQGAIVLGSELHSWSRSGFGFNNPQWKVVASSEQQLHGLSGQIRAMLHLPPN
jgi:hypothetical protein